MNEATYMEYQMTPILGLMTEVLDVSGDAIEAIEGTHMVEQAVSLVGGGRGMG